MELYRVLSTPLLQSDCFCDQYLRELYKRACPELPSRPEDLDLGRLAEDEAKIFFPSTAIYNFIIGTQKLLENITKCPCSSCTSHMPNSGQRKDLLKQCRDSPENASLIVANLIYLRETRMLYNISTSIDFREQGIGEVRLTEHPVFERNFSRTKALFKPPTLRLGHTTSHFEPGTRFPYINEENCGGGSFGVVTKFEIHDDYIDEEVKELVHRYMPDGHVPAGTKLYFARKTIRGARNQNLMEEVQLERDVLGVIREQLEEDKKHLMDLIAFYTFGDEINMVFPYLEGNLEKLLYVDWLPSNVNHDEQFPNNWISRGLLGLADGLRVIHNPPTQKHLAEKGTIVGFHFDLKPANILITADGTFKITDFGQALIKLVKVGEVSSGGVPHLGGDPRYAPPEEIPTRERITRSSYKYLHEDRSVPQGRRLTVHEPQTDAVSVSSQRLNVPTRFPGSRVSQRSAAVPQEPLGSAKYDIWSLGCVALETLVHTCLGGRKAVEEFRDDRHRNGPSGAFHTSQGKYSELQICVQNQLDALRTGQSSTYSWSSPMQAYMQELVNLLQKMLSIMEDDRPDAPKVAYGLDWALKKFKIAETDEDGLYNTLRARTSHMLKPGWSELAHDAMGTSFIDIEDIFVRDFNIGPSTSRCRIRVFANRPHRGDGGASEVIVSVAFKEKGENGEVKVETFSCPMSKTTRYSPLYLNTATDAAWKDSCRVQTDKFDKLFWFKLKPAELLSFQAVLFQYVVEPGRVTAESSVTEHSWNPYRSISPPVNVVFTSDNYTVIELKALAVQIWTTKTHTSTQKFPSQVTIPSASSTTSSGQTASRTRLVIFLDPQENAKTRKRYHVLQIPLEPRLGSIVEAVEGTDAVATTLSFEPTDKHATNGGFTVLLSKVHERFPKSPALSLDPEIYKRVTDPPPERRCRGITISFHANSARAAIQTIRRHFETANESNQPKITWKERPPNRRLRRSIP